MTNANQYVQIGTMIKIPAPNVIRRRGESAQTISAKVVHINNRGNYATVSYCLPTQKQPLTTTVQLRPVVRTNKRGNPFRTYVLAGTTRSAKIGGPLNASMPTPFGQNMVSAAARR